MNVVPPIVIAMLCYLWCAIGTARQSPPDYPHSLMWIAYAVAQGGLLWFELSKGHG